ncbi:molybdenum cofactor biosynthesis protein [Alicyclobacillus dauci]|uniref:Molybdenum cofactor biosynthesis protein MoaE n=1 Tax=Alicyclobacillus dauci TaxID=1475485 RepID=A0ABY6Z827_9BACL|nr:molybdenum cofactor biosynthesis protein MoaE [Alicyclobacillus dauci]WAH39042.1 molybdenum cofactor biosynthesis protein MoaE [Alicyclobacillus dauci]
MQLRVRLFANLREVFGSDEMVLDLDGDILAGQLIDHIKSTYPALASSLTNVMVARNQTIIAPSEKLAETDEIALIPPVGGGETPNHKEGSLRLSEDPLSVDEAYRYLEDINHGGTVIFVGTVREWTRGRQTSHLSYEAYVSMAELQMKQIQSEVENDHPGVTTIQWHRIGRLEPKDIAVICGASSPHRNAAFEAARTLIERLKKEVTIWKKEVYVDGNSVWQANEQPSEHDSTK